MFFFSFQIRQLKKCQCWKQSIKHTSSPPFGIWEVAYCESVHVSALLGILLFPPILLTTTIFGRNMKSGDVLVRIITFSFLHTTFLKTGAFLESIIPTVDLYCSSLELDFTNIHIWSHENSTATIRDQNPNWKTLETAMYQGLNLQRIEKSLKCHFWYVDIVKYFKLTRLSDKHKNKSMPFPWRCAV